MDENNNEQATQLVAHGKVSSLLKTQQPFSIILQKSTSTIGLLERVMKDTIDSV